MGTHVPASTRLASAASMLAVLDGTIRNGRNDPAALAMRLAESAAKARPLPAGTKTRSRVVPTTRIDESRSPTFEKSADWDSPFAEIAAALLRQAGFDLRGVPNMARRLSVALDVTISHWLGDARPGGGLPEFRPEHDRFHPNRLFVQLGADRDLLALVYGPHPGRGRPLQVARQRGLAYWVGVAWVAEQLGQPPPHLPPKVVAHWRRELHRLSAPRVDAMGQETNSRYEPSA